MADENRALLEEIIARLDGIEETLGVIVGQVNKTVGLELTDLRRGLEMKDELLKIEREVAESSDAVDAAVTLIGSLADEIRASAGDADKLNDLADKLDANSKRLADAVVANTPFQPSAR